jgi:hypothetical protein
MVLSYLSHESVTILVIISLSGLGNEAYGLGAGYFNELYLYFAAPSLAFLTR